MKRITRYLILAAIGGFLGWAVVEPINYLTPPGDPTMGYDQILLLGAVIGLFIGLGLGVAEGLSAGSMRSAIRCVIMGAAIGAAGGAFGLLFGNFFYRVFHGLAGDRGGPAIPGNVPLSNGPPRFIAFLLDLFGRSIGWALIGLFIGLAQGIASQSTKKMTNGAIGGLLGGGVGGFAFQILRELNGTQTMAIPVELMRMIGFTVTGGAIGLFIGFIEEVTKQAWLVRLIGRNEGKEFTIYKPETFIGRDEFADVPVFGDPDVEPRHFVIRADQRRHKLQDLGTVAGTSVNGQKVQQAMLSDGDVIQVGMTKLLYRDKATRSLIERPDESYIAPKIPTSDKICPFCGSIKDASGNCSCSVAGGAPPAAPGDATAATQNVTVAQPSQPAQPAPSQTMPWMAPPAAKASGGAPKLTAVSGPYAGQSYNLSQDAETTIGRQSDRTISLANDNTVSRQHARIVNEGGGFVIYDMGSANGTYVNNARITSQTLAAGDVVQIGSTKFRYEA